MTRWEVQWGVTSCPEWGHRARGRGQFSADMRVPYVDLFEVILHPAKGICGEVFIPQPLPEFRLRIGTLLSISVNACRARKTFEVCGDRS